MMVNAGTDQGVMINKPVIFQGILIGKVEKVFSNSALIQTIFDSSFKTPVRVGSGGYDALLMGGAYPKVAMIQKTAGIQPGDIIYSTSEGFPYGLPIAITESTTTSLDNLFQEAPLSVAYDINSIQTVFIAQ